MAQSGNECHDAFSWVGLCLKSISVGVAAFEYGSARCEHNKVLSGRRRQQLSRHQFLKHAVTVHGSSCAVDERWSDN